MHSKIFFRRQPFSAFIEGNAELTMAADGRGMQCLTPTYVTDKKSRTTLKGSSAPMVLVTQLQL